MIEKAIKNEPVPVSSTEAQRALGQQLFNDPKLSADGAHRCSSCHVPQMAYTDGRRVAIGVDGRLGTRNTPSLSAISTLGNTSYFWDGRRATLEQAVMDPFINPVEMGLHDSRALINKLIGDSAYRIAFAKSFPDAHGITTENIATALAVYIRSLNPVRSAYDRYRAQHDPNLLSAQAQQGLLLFSGKGQCAECHRLEGVPATLTDHAYHRTSVPLDAVEKTLPVLTQAVVERSLQDSDVGNRIATHDDEALLGRFNVTRNPADIGLFRTPSLRSVALTAPYMHDGSVATLDEAIDREVYYRSLQTGHPLSLSVQERKELKAFLETL